MIIIKKYILFDLDGTVTDPMIGITKSVQYALNKFDIEVEDLNELCKFIGPPLKDSFMNFYNFTEEDALNALEVGNEVPIWNTPTAVDKYLYNNCPLKFVQDRLKEQYSDPDIYLSEYCNYVRGKCSVLKFPKIPKFSRIEFEVMDKDGMRLSRSESTNMWISFSDTLHMDIVDTNGLSMRKLRRLLKKWSIPVGFAVHMRVYTGYRVSPLMRVTTFSK